MSGVIAIVGRPNVGKSALFNRIAGRRIAIVHDQPGVTRDRVTAEVEWQGHSFTLIDTGGIGLRRGERVDDVITQAALDQVGIAIESAHAIIFVVNVQEGLVPLDEEVSARLRAAGKPVLLAANKSDNDSVASGAVDFARLGFDRLYPVSAIHGRGLDALLRATVPLLPPEEAEPGAVDAQAGQVPGEPADGPEEKDAAEAGDPSNAGTRNFKTDPLRLAIVGRPNVGKSSLINAITQSNRVVVSPIPGTTRDAIDVPFDVETDGRSERYVLVDTAGVRKRRAIDNSVEFFSVKRTEEAIERSDIVVFVLDAGDGILEQDKKIGALITEARRACIVVINKWDLVEEGVREAREKEMERRKRSERTPGISQRMTTLTEFGQWVQDKLFFLDYAPVIFTSAQSGFHLDRLLEAVRYVGAQLRQRVPTAVLNRTIQDAVTRRQPVSKSGGLLKFYYATQIGQAPPKFVLFFNRKDLLDRAYEKHLTNCLRTAFGYEGCPLILIPRERTKTIEPVRKNLERAAAARAARRQGPRAGKPKAAESRAPRPAGRTTYGKPAGKPTAKPVRSGSRASHRPKR